MTTVRPARHTRPRLPRDAEDVDVDVDVVPGASGGPKWLVLAGLDRFLFGDFLQRPRTRPLHLIRIPDRRDFYRLPDAERLRAWRTTGAESERTADELRELVATGRVADRVRPL